MIGSVPAPSVDVMITTILSGYSNNQIAVWLSSNAGCGINTAILGTDPFPSVIFGLLEAYPDLKTGLINQYTRSEVIDAMIAYDIEYTWQFVVDGLSPGTVMDEIFNHEPTTAYDVLLQYFWAYVDEVQTANYYYSKTQYFQHIKDEYGQYTYDVLVGKFIHLSNQFKDMFALTEWHMYGSSRLGVQKPAPVMLNGSEATAGRELVHIEFEGTWNQYTESFTDTSNTTTTTYQMSYDYFSLTRGEKNYEMVNHLGNVLVIISDKKLKTCEGDTVNYYMADVLQATDYSAFGVILKDREYYANSSNKYRFGFNTQERDDEISGNGNSYTAEFWQYDARLGKRFNLDPVVKAECSGYLTFGNNPIFFTDVYGDDWFKDQNGNVKYFDNSSGGFSDLEKNSWTNIGSTKNVPTKLIEQISNGSIENNFTHSYTLTETLYYNAIHSKDGNIPLHVMNDIKRPYNLKDGQSIPTSINTVDEDGVPLTVKVEFGPGFESDNYHTPNNKIAPFAVDGFIEGIILANNDGACLSSVTINATTNAHHHKSMKGVNWHKSPSTHYVIKGGARAIDIGKLNGNLINKKNPVAGIVQKSFLRVSNIYEVYGPTTNVKSGNKVADQQHYSWIHVSFNRKQR